ncbi:hypothetical protein [Candidatus Ichthyocystis hellenicum]|uniref:hypothetical protein n=1 Tax=Candidatus Ichthyocystis hellenicum TaxID=1561003 RepID=UPI000B844159|nr:hypothetical protein [Candidatus Ichthyocystis hellenicum]
MLRMDRTWITPANKETEHDSSSVEVAVADVTTNVGQNASNITSARVIILASDTEQHVRPAGDLLPAISRCSLQLLRNFFVMGVALATVTSGISFLGRTDISTCLSVVLHIALVGVVLAFSVALIPRARLDNDSLRNH